MRFDATRLSALLPAIYRVRDEEGSGSLEALLSVLAAEIATIEDDLDRLYDDQFIETCADWVVPYIGDLVGYRALHGVVSRVRSPRAEVANTIAYRRRKGTAAMLEQLARDVTGWNARVVEFFEFLATTQYMNHLRPGNVYAPNLRDWETLDRLHTPFDAVAHTADVRRIASGRGRYNIPNIGIFLWRLDAYSLTDSPVVPLDNRRCRFSPLGCDTSLFTRPVAEPEITHLAMPLNVPGPIGRRVLRPQLSDYYGQGRSLLVKRNDDAIMVEHVVFCNLADAPGDTWAHMPPVDVDTYAIDPELGRLVVPADVSPDSVRVTFHYAFSAAIGGGQYDRARSLTSGLAPIEHVPSPHVTIQVALDALPDAGGAVEISENVRLVETPAIAIKAPDARIELRAADGFRPTLVLAGDLEVTGPDLQDENVVAEGELTINGLVMAGGAIRVLPSAGHTLRRLRLRHCTLVPGRVLAPDGEPVEVDLPSLVVEADAIVEIEDSIVGGLSIAPGARVSINNSIMDATSDSRIAYAAPGGAPSTAGGSLRIENSTVIGRIDSVNLELVSNSILLARSPDATPSIRSERRQAGCLRFSYVPPGSQVPRRHRCQPAGDADDVRVRPQFTSLRYGNAAYCQLSRRAAPEITKGADDDSEMGVFHDVFQPQRETNLRVRLDEYLRFNLEAGLFDGT